MRPRTDPSPARSSRRLLHPNHAANLQGPADTLAQSSTAAAELHALEDAWIVAKAVEHESVDMATAHSRVAMKSAAGEQHGERGAPACQKDRRYAGHMETVVQEAFCLRCRHSDAHP